MYTQWEYLPARHHGRPCYLFLTDPPAVDGEPEQAVWHAWLRRQGDHYDPLSDLRQLDEDVLVLDLPDLPRPMPMALPYPSLGSLGPPTSCRPSAVRRLFSGVGVVVSSQRDYYDFLPPLRGGPSETSAKRL